MVAAVSSGLSLHQLSMSILFSFTKAILKEARQKSKKFLH